ncbi:MAG: phospho-N-acetylmuramoyl-pentapeptide-transferase [Puniceicoccales bacterium]|jgi:phospho-N-acetylmuramoyl-pentapeptide-transferase|nr:phospho-N-acetylmuramoyl-pentapeptide-transferase [Puniceicoccales bacterium]
MLYYLHFLREYWGPARLAEYQSVRAFAAGAIALLFGYFISSRLIECFKRRGYYQGERGAAVVGDSAKDACPPVPTFGSALIFAPALASVVLFVRPNALTLTALYVWLGMAAVGFADDYKKVFVRNADGSRGDGLSERAKTLWLAFVAFAGAAFLLAVPETRTQFIEVWIPIYKHALLSLDTYRSWFAGVPEIAVPFAEGWVFSPALLVGGAVATAVFVGVTWCTSNAVNLTDGMDGLSAGCVITNLLAFGLVAYLCGHANFANYLHISRVAGAGELAVMSAALLGGCLVFLWHNAHPASIYMGDAGALGLGGFVGTVAVMTNHPLLILVIGGVFVAEAGSALLQRRYFKWTKGKAPPLPDGTPQGWRIFKATPLHMHFKERSREGILVRWPIQGRSWPEEKIVVRFWMASLLCALAGLASLKLR